MSPARPDGVRLRAHESHRSGLRPDGSLYAVEIATGLLAGPIGSLKKVTPGSSEHETVLGGLFAPYGVAFGGGAAYVTTCAVCIGGGEVIKIGLD